MRVSRSVGKRIAAMLHPFDVMFVSLLVIGMLPMDVPWIAASWMGMIIVGTLVLRLGSRQRAQQLLRASLVRSREPRSRRA